jgi:hypothetical protein
VGFAAFTEPALTSRDDVTTQMEINVRDRTPAPRIDRRTLAPTASSNSTWTADHGDTESRPFIRRPQWGEPYFGILRINVEVKLIRARSDIRKSTDEILADIPKYTARRRSALFLVYDAGGFIADDDAFAAQFEPLGPVRIRVLR